MKNKNKIEEYLKRRNMIYRELAELVFVSPVTMSRYANGTRTPNVYDAIRIANALKADVYDVFPLEGEGFCED